MKTIKLIILLSISTLISCSKGINEYEDFIEPISEIRETYKLKEYYEKTVVIDSQTNPDDIYGYSYTVGSNSISLGYSIFTGRYNNKTVLDTLVIDLTGVHHKINKIFLSGGSKQNSVEFTYATINHLEIVGWDDSSKVTFIGNDDYGKVKINSSNISIEKLNENSVRNNNIAYDIFEKVELFRKEVSFTFREHSTPQYPSTYHNFVNQEKGFIGYGYGKNEGTKYELISRNKF